MDCDIGGPLLPVVVLCAEIGPTPAPLVEGLGNGGTPAPVAEDAIVSCPASTVALAKGKGTKVLEAVNGYPVKTAR